MRTIWLAVVPVVLLTGMPAMGQSSNRKKPTRPTTTWAIEQVQYTEGQPGLPPALSESIPGPNFPDYPQATIPPAGRPYGAGPQLPHGTPAVIPPAGHPVAGGPGPHDGGHHGCGCGREHLSVFHRLLAWFCWKPCRGCQKYPCGPCCRVPVHCYFHGCKEGYSFCALPPCQPCPKPDFWGQIYATGHRMFAMPSGHGMACSQMGCPCGNCGNCGNRGNRGNP